MKWMDRLRSGLQAVKAMDPNAIRGLEKRVRDLEAIADIVLEEGTNLAEELGAFNGQKGRREIITALAERLGIARIMETGTFLGTTTAYCARTLAVPVYSVELNRRYHLAAARRLSGDKGIYLHLCDSRTALRTWGADRGTHSGCTLFYLDAHGGSDLPLLEEIEIIAGTWEAFTIIVDDFRVPWDPGYGYDDYGAAGSLTPELIRGVCQRRQLATFYPSLPSSEETGARRGCVVIVPATLAGVLRGLPVLREDDGQRRETHLRADPPASQ
jgi:hypothetical protein